jgi:O-antigen ligase
MEGLAYVAFTFLLLQTMQDGRHLRTYGGGFIASAAGLSAVGLMAIGGLVSFPSAVLGGRVASTLQYPNTLAALLLISLLISLGFLVQYRSVWQRMILGCAATVFFLTFLLTSSRAAFLSACPALLVGWALVPRGLRLDATVLWFSALVPPLLVLRSITANLAIDNPVSASKWLSLSLFLTLSGIGYWMLLGRLWPRLLRRIGTLAAAMAIVFVSLVVVLGISNMMPWPADLQALASRLNPEPLLARLEDTTLETHSASQRLQYYSDALSLGARRPILGWGGGGWASLYGMCQPYLYIASEVHNHFLQVWVETGALGVMAFTAIWAVFIASLRAAYRKPDGYKAILAGLSGATAGFGLHSALDFNFSYMAVFLWFWTLLAVSATWAGDEGIPIQVRRVVEWAALKVSRLKTVMLFVAVMLSFLASLMALGQVQLRAANSAWQNGHYEEAEARFRWARSLDPLCADVASDMLFFYVTLYRYEPTDAGAAKVTEAASALARLDPYGPVHNAQVTEAYLETALWDKALGHARHTVRLQPFKADHYERWSVALSGRLMEAFRERDTIMARGLAMELAGLPEIVLERREQALPHAARTDTNHPQIDLMPRIALEAAKARYFLQDWAGAEDMLEVAYDSVGLRLEVNRWSYILYEAMVEAGVLGAAENLASLQQVPSLRFIHLQPEYIGVRSLPFLARHSVPSDDPTGTGNAKGPGVASKLSVPAAYGNMLAERYVPPGPPAGVAPPYMSHSTRGQSSLDSYQGG